MAPTCSTRSTDAGANLHDLALTNARQGHVNTRCHLPNILRPIPFNNARQRRRCAVSREQDIAAHARPVTGYLTQYEHADPDAARVAGWVIGWLRVDRFFFWSWWLEPITACAFESIEITDPPVAVLTRLTRRLGVQVSDAYLPHCHGCRTPLQLADMRVPVPTGYCLACPAPARRRPAPAPGGVVTVPAQRVGSRRPGTAEPLTLPDQFELIEVNR